MTEQAYSPGYRTLSPEALAERDAHGVLIFPGDEVQETTTADRKPRLGLDGFHKVLTWSILSVCLALWAVIGFIFWVPLLLRSMVRFSMALSGSMLSGEEPVEAGRILRDTVSFYRRGFTVAIGAVFGDERNEPARPKGKKVARKSTREFTFELLGVGVFWYLVLLFLGVVDISPVDGWIALFQFPWGDLWAAMIEGFLRLIGR